MRDVTGHQRQSVFDPAQRPESYPDDSLRWQSFVSSVRAIPVLADSVYRLSNLLMISPVDLAAVSRVIRADVGLAAQILKLANSGLADVPIHDLDSAIVHLGVEPIRAFILTVPVLPSDGPAPMLRLWEHGVECARVCAWLAHTLKQYQNQAYVAGLLHDLGRIPLIAWRLATHSALLPKADELICADPDQEDAQFGINHQVIGGWMAVTWDLPDILIEASERHHNPSSSINSGLLNIISAADKFCYYYSGLTEKRTLLDALSPIAIRESEEQLLVHMSDALCDCKNRSLDQPIHPVSINARMVHESD
jgi:HD-like signal output (HDOD) protein